jgi:glycolate oxidase FAD binding subunit
LLYGTARDLLIGVKVVHADGAISKAGGKVTKNVTGYDMMKLYIGSLGTLAVIVEATLKLRPLPPVQQTAWATFSSLETAGEAARRVRTSGLLPNALEVVNPSLSGFLQRALERSGGLEGWSVIIGVDGSPQAVNRQLHDLESLVREVGALAWQTWPDDGHLWQVLQRRFRVDGPARDGRVILRLGTVSTQVGMVLNRLTDLGLRLSTPVDLTARFGNGLVYASLTLDGTAEQLTQTAQALAELRGHLATLRGYVVVESAPASLKALFDCWGDLGPQAEVMASLKREFDPQRVLNPGRYIHHL